MARLLYILFLFATLSLNAQVGINTETPETTLDVVGKPNDTNHHDGIIPPRITGDQLAAKFYTSTKKGAIVFVTVAPSNIAGQVIHVLETGLYFFDGNVWKPFEDDTLEDVVVRGNYSPKFISFIGSTANPLRDGAIGMDKNTYSIFFGNMNPNHTGTYNLSQGYGALQNLTSGKSNTAIGSFSLKGLTTGEYNTFVGFASGYNFLNPNKVTTGNVNVAVGNSTFSSITSGYKNIAIGQSTLKELTIGSYNTVVGQNSGAFITTENKNVMLGAQSGAYVKGDNNVFIGTGAGHSNTVDVVENVSNRLVIHGNANLVPQPNIGAENMVDLSASWTNGLIIGDFAQRWVKFNGRFQINPNYISTASTAYTKMLVYNPSDGEIATQTIPAIISVPQPPQTGTFILKSVDGVMQWVLN